MKIICKDHPEWGVFYVIRDCGEWYEIRSYRGDRVLFKSEMAKFWEIVQ